MVPNIKYPRLSDARIVISNETVPAGSRADEGNQTPIDPKMLTAFTVQGLKWKGTTFNSCPSVRNSGCLVVI